MTDEGRTGRLSASTGTHCPRTGLWWVPGQEDSTIYAFEGNLMPTHQGSATEWTWTVPDFAL